MSKPRAKEDFSRYELELDACLTTVTVRVRLEWNFESRLQPRHAKNVWGALVAQGPKPTPHPPERLRYMLAKDPESYKRAFVDAVVSHWGSREYFLEATAYPPAKAAGGVSKQCEPNPTYGTLGPGTPRRVDIAFDLPETTWNEHEDIEVLEDIYDLDPEEGRQRVDPRDGVMVDIYTDPGTVAHEFGHVLGHPDEYNPSELSCDSWRCSLSNWVQRIAVSDARHYKDTTALMNDGSPGYDELRARYFGFVRDWVNKVTDYRYMFQVRPHRNLWDEEFPEEAPNGETLGNKLEKGSKLVYERPGKEHGHIAVNCNTGAIQIDLYHVYGTDAKHLQTVNLSAGNKWRGEFPRQEDMAFKRNNRAVITGRAAGKSRYRLAMSAYDV